MKKKEQRETPFSAEEAATFCEQVALIIKSGVPLNEGVAMLAADGAHPMRDARLKTLSQALEETGSLYDAVVRAGLFPAHMANMIRLGEKTGQLDSVMDKFAQYYEREIKIHAAVRSAIVYPMVLIGMMAVVVAVLSIKVLPIFEQVFRSMGTDMSAASSSVMRFGATAGRFVLVLVAVLIALAFLSALLLKTRWSEPLKAVLARIFPPLNTIRRDVCAARFAAVMSMMLTSGYPMEDALAMMPDVIEDEQWRRRIKDCLDKLGEDASFPDVIAALGLFDSVQEKTIQVAHVSGRLDQVMTRLADLCEEAVDDRIYRLIGLLEPTLVAVLSVVIGAILLAVMLPLAGILSAMV